MVLDDATAETSNGQFQPLIDALTVALRNASTSSQTSSSASGSTQALVLNFESFNSEAEKFSQCKERFEIFAELKNLNRDLNLKKATFINCAGREVFETLKALAAPKSISELSFEDCVNILSKHLSPQTNQLLEQHRFLSRFQKDGETISQFVTALKSYLTDSEFKCDHCSRSISSQFLRAQFIRGLKNSSIRKKLLLEAKLDFESAVTKAIAIENSTKINQEIKNGTTPNPDINKVSRAQQQRNRAAFKSSYYNNRQRSASRADDNFNSKRSSSSSSYRGPSHSRHQGQYRNHSKSRVNLKELGIGDLCCRCGAKNHKSRECRVRNLKCKSCNKTGHVASVCITTLIQNKNRLNYMEDKPEYSDFNSHPSISNISGMETVNLFCNSPLDDTRKFRATVLIDDKPVIFEVDSGCGYTLLPYSEFLKLNLKGDLCPSTKQFRTYDNGIVVPLGTKNVSVTFKNKSCIETLYVVPSNFSALLGRSWIRRLSINLNDIDEPVVSKSKSINNVTHPL